jgi:hypothetical protein
MVDAFFESQKTTNSDQEFSGLHLLIRHTVLARMTMAQAQTANKKKRGLYFIRFI